MQSFFRSVLVLRVFRVSRSACIFPAGSSLAEIRENSQSKVDRSSRSNQGPGPQLMKGGAGVSLSLGRTAIFCSPTRLRRQRHTTHLEIRCLTTEFSFTIQYWFLSALNVIPCPAWAIFSWALRIMRSTTKLFFGRITGYLKSSGNSYDLASLPPTRIRPFLFKIGSRRYRTLDLLISDFLALARLRSLWQSCS